jgi:cardiolipin synthase (CMP-forming)
VTLPNLISLARLLAVPVIVWRLVSGDYASAFLLIIAAGLSDALDGYLAKRFGWHTPIGALLDPLADKTLIVGVYITLGVLGHLPSWLVILVASRDLMIVGGTALSGFVNYALRTDPLFVSKINTALQIVLLVLVSAKLGLRFEDRGAVMIVSYVVAATTVVSGALYLRRWVRGTLDLESDR